MNKDFINSYIGPIVAGVTLGLLSLAWVSFLELKKGLIVLESLVHSVAQMQQDTKEYNSKTDARLSVLERDTYYLRNVKDQEK